MPDYESDDHVLTKSKKVTKLEKADEKPVKQRKPKTEAQIKQFADMARKRMQNIALENNQKN